MFRIRKEGNAKAAFEMLFWYIGISLLLLLSAAAVVILGRDDEKATAVLSSLTVQRSVIIDAGHGGEDGGCSGYDGTLEKNLNMLISEELYELFTANGWNVIMTRTEDKLLYTEEQNIKGQRKMFDLKNRVEYAKANTDALFISIHMNKFESSKYSGLQVYFPEKSTTGKALAELIQVYTESYLQPDNKRKTKAAGSEIYILDKNPCTAVLIECGFLSNTAELEKLNNPEYRQQLALCIFTSVCAYRENTD